MVSPYINRFLSADMVVPNAAEPQAFNRYTYVLGNPIRYVDPSGNIPIDCWNDPSYCSNTTTLPSSPFASTPPRLPPPCTRNCGDKGEDFETPGDVVTTPEEMINETVSLIAESLCQEIFQNDSQCSAEFYARVFDPASPGSLPSIINDTLNNPCLGNFWSCYDPDAIIFGGSLSGSSPTYYMTSGIELLEMTSNGGLALYLYGGEGSSAGFGANGAGYVGTVFNLESPENYVGPFGCVGVTVSVFSEGATVFYFWDSTQAPLQPGVTQGLAFGWAPGAEVSIWGASTAYAEIWSSVP